MSCNIYDILPLFYFLSCAILDFVNERLTRADPPELGHYEEIIMFTIIVKSRADLDNSHLTEKQARDYICALVKGWKINIFDIMVLEEI